MKAFEIFDKDEIGEIFENCIFSDFGCKGWLFRDTFFEREIRNGEPVYFCNGSRFDSKEKLKDFLSERK